jgi:uncharacterized protein (DUF1800 family)
MDDGIKVIDLLARHPATEKFIATKLARRFVADDPPASLVNRAAEAFRRSDGDIRTVLQTIIEAPEFFAPEAYQAKVKKPLEYVASALRVTAAETKVTHQLLRYLGRMGEPLFLAQPPTGYPDVGASWISPDMLLTRMNFATDLVANRLDGARLQTQSSPDIQTYIRLIAPDSLSTATRAALAETAGSDTLALLLAAPEFQRR